MKPVFSGIIVALLMLCSVKAGIQPGSKELGAIWFIGDSITQSNADGDRNGSPRKSLYDLLTANGYRFTYTGHHTRNVDGLPATGTNTVDNLYHYHSGVSGILIGEATGKGFRGQLSKDWNSGRLAVVKPDVILIMLGTNDIGHRYKEAEAPNRLRALLHEIYALPDIGTPTVFVASIPPNGRSESEAENVAAFNEQVPRIVKEFQALEKDIHFVDQFTALNADYAANMQKDNLHPNATGNSIMAREWFKAISACAGNQELPGEKTDFHGYVRYEVPIGKGTVSVVCPKVAAPGKPWVWRSIFWGGNSGAVKRVTDADLQLLAQGYYVVKAPGDVSGHPRGNEKIDAAYDLLTRDYGFSKTLSMGSMSRETLALFRWASAHPDRVESIYVDNGVCNVNSWPAGKQVPGSPSKGTGDPASWELLKKTYGFATDAEALNARISPIDLLAPLARADVPILMVCGTLDTTVPYEENGAIMKERYEKLGGRIRIIFEKKGHHPHGSNNPAPIIEFIKKHTRLTENSGSVRNADSLPE